MGGGGDVEEDHLVRALFVVADRQLHRIADIAEAALLGDTELHAAGDLTVMHVETGNDSFGQHVGETLKHRPG